MTIGIYSLYWEEQDLIYIGQSQNIESRFKEHLNLLGKNKHTNYKVQDAFHKYGLPILNVLEECTLNELNNLEIYWQKEFNSLNSLDLIEAGQVGYGANSNSSKYSKLQILLAFRLLRSTSYKYTYIAEILKVTESLIQDIFRGATHLWLKEKYPKMYIKMKNNRKSIDNRKCLATLGKSKEIKSPEGIIYLITNIKQFAIQHNLDSAHLGKVLNKKYIQHKGWTLP